MSTDGISKGALWTGRVLSALPVLLMLGLVVLYFFGERLTRLVPPFWPGWAGRDDILSRAAVVAAFSVLGYFLAQVLTRRFDPFAPVWLFLVGFVQVYIIQALSFRAQTLDQKPIQGKGELTLYQITYDDKNEPVEKAVQSWKLDTNVEGQAIQQIKQRISIITRLQPLSSH